MTSFFSSEGPLYQWNRHNVKEFTAAVKTTPGTHFTRGAPKKGHEINGIGQLKATDPLHKRDSQKGEEFRTLRMQQQEPLYRWDRQ